MAEPNKTYTIPYRSQLQEKFEPGQTLIVKGRANEDAQRFAVSLHCKSADFAGNVDIPLHISVRYDEGKMVFNTCGKGEWGKEEKKSNPLKRGDAFDLRIRAHDHQFQIMLDQKDFKEFEYRLPLGSVSHMSIEGDIQLTKVHWGGKYYPVPYESGLTNGFQVGKKLYVYATPEKKGRRFNMNLLKKNGDIALHFNARFDEKAVVRNAMEGGEWGNEERGGKLPFEKGVGFDLAIANEPTHFEVYINDQLFTKFAHRSDPHDITGLQIQGDIELTGMQVH